MEDIVLVLGGSNSAQSLINEAPLSVKAFLSNEFRILLDDQRFEEAVYGFHRKAKEPEGRSKLILDRMRLIFAPNKYSTDK